MLWALIKESGQVIKQVWGEKSNVQAKNGLEPTLLTQQIL